MGTSCIHCTLCVLGAAAAVLSGMLSLLLAACHVLCGQQLQQWHVLLGRIAFMLN